MADKRLYIRIRGRVIGPFNHQQLMSLRERGQFQRFHEVSADRKRWQPASVVTEVFPDNEAESVEVEPAAAGKMDGRQGVGAEPAPALSPAEWYYANPDGQQGGPIPREQVLGLWQSGAMTPATLVWKEGMANWVALSASELGAALGARAGGMGAGAFPGRAGQGEVMLAVKGFFADPSGGLLPLCEALGNTGSLWVGLAFCAVIDLCLVLGSFLANWDVDKLPGVTAVLGATPSGAFGVATGATTSAKMVMVLKFITIGVFPLLALGGTIAIVRAISGRNARIGYDMLVAGAVLLPLGLLVPVAVLLDNANPDVKMFVYVLLVVLPLLILNGGLTRVVGISDRGAFLALPVVIAINLWLWKVAWTSVILN
jgi:hypothetical protein